MSGPVCVELCAGGGGQALGLELAGFEHISLFDLDPACCTTLRRNRESWKVLQTDIKHVDGSVYKGIDLLAAGFPALPFRWQANNWAMPMTETCFPPRCG